MRNRQGRLDFLTIKFIVISPLRIANANQNITMTKPFFLIALALATIFSAFAEKPPKLKPDKSVYDFGTVLGAESVTGKFKLTNEGDAPLKFGEPRVSCGCTVASIKPASLEPGQSADLEFTLTMPAARVRLNKEITVLSNDPEKPELTLRLTGDYIPRYEITPPAFNVDIRDGEATNLIAHLTRIDGKDLNVEKLESSKPWIKADIKHRGTNWIDIALTLKPHGQPRRLFEFVSVYSPETNVPVAMVQVLGRIVGDVAINPDSLFWSLTDTNQLSNEAFTTRNLSITASAPGKELEVKSATSSIPELKVTGRKVGNGYQLTAKLDRVPNNTFQGKVVVITTDPKQPILEVPITIYVPQTLAKQLAGTPASPK
jgi:hypothetical protein